MAEALAIYLCTNQSCMNWQPAPSLAFATANNKLHVNCPQCGTLMHHTAQGFSPNDTSVST